MYWDLIPEEHHRWNYKSQGLTPGGAAVIALAMTMATGGIAGPTIMGSTTLAAMTSAGITTLATQATVALVNNQGNVGKALKTLGSMDTVKALATSMVAAGVVDGLGVSLGSAAGESQGAAASAGSKSVRFATEVTYIEPTTLQRSQTHLHNNALHMGTTTGCHMAMEGKMDSKTLLQSVAQTPGPKCTGTCANEIGDLRAEGALNGAPHKVLHGALGALLI